MVARRLLIVTEPMEYGVLSYVERLCDGLTGSRWEPALAFSPRRMTPQGRSLVDRLVARGVRVRRLPFHRGLGLGDLRAVLGLLDEMRKFRPDVVHLHSTKAGIVGRIVGVLAGVPALYTPHGTSWHYTGRVVGRAQLALERALRHATTALVSVCPEEAATFVDEVGFDPARVRIVRNGVRLADDRRLAHLRDVTRRALGLSSGDVWLVFVGRLTAEKGADVLLRALEGDVAAHGLLVVGEGPERAALEARARRARIPVRFCGYQSDVSPFLAAADVFVQPSRSEGLPFALLEAMAHGLPVVCTRVGGIASAVDGCGVVVPPGDAAGLRLALAALIRDAAVRRALAEAGRARVARWFGEAAMVRELETTYGLACGERVPDTTESAIGGRPARRPAAWTGEAGAAP